MYVDPTNPELHIILVTSDDDPSPSRASAPIRPCRCKLRIESAMMRAVFFWYPPDVTMSMGTPRRLAALNTISSLFTMPWQRKKRESLVSLSTAAVLLISLIFVKLLANVSIYALFLPWGGRGGLEAVRLFPYLTSPLWSLSGPHTWEERNTHPCLSRDWEWEQLVSKIPFIMEQFVAQGLILNIIRHDRNTCSTRTLNNNY